MAKNDEPKKTNEYPVETGIVKTISEQREFMDYSGNPGTVCDLEIEVQKPVKRRIIFACFNETSEIVTQLPEGEKVNVTYQLNSVRNKYKIVEHKVIAKQVDVIQ